METSEDFQATLDHLGSSYPLAEARYEVDFDPVLGSGANRYTMVGRRERPQDFSLDKYKRAQTHTTEMWPDGTIVEMDYIHGTITCSEPAQSPPVGQQMLQHAVDAFFDRTVQEELAKDSTLSPMHATAVVSVYMNYVKEAWDKDILKLRKLLLNVVPSIRLQHPELRNDLRAACFKALWEMRDRAFHVRDAAWRSGDVCIK